MSSTNVMRNYKHDISGKFKDISTAIAGMNEDAFNDPENNEIFHAVHEVLLKMVKTSRNTMLENLKQEIVLLVSDEAPDLTVPKLQIEGVTVRYEMKDERMEYFYFVEENSGDAKSNIAKIVCVLPVKSIRSELKIEEVAKGLECDGGRG